jgi:hypothetical protein
MESRITTIMDELNREKKEGADYIIEDAINDKPMTMDALEVRFFNFNNFFLIQNQNFIAKIRARRKRTRW